MGETVGCGEGTMIPLGALRRVIGISAVRRGVLGEARVGISFPRVPYTSCGRDI